METDLESAAWKGESTGRSSATPLWIWLVVLGLGALAIYAGFEALGRDQLYQEAEKARAALARDKDHLQANATDLNRQLDDANKRNDATEAALKQSRADTAAASGQIADLQAQVTKLQEPGDRPTGRSGGGRGQREAGNGAASEGGRRPQSRTCGKAEEARGRTR